MPDADAALLQTAATVRRGTMRLGRRLRTERPESVVASAELSVLGLLSRRGPMTAGDLAWAERVQPQTLTRTLAALERRGEIARRVDPEDRRRSLLSITDRGTEVLVADVAQRDSWLTMAMAEQLTPTEVALLGVAGELLERLAEADAAALHRSATPPSNTPHAVGDGAAVAGA